MILGLITTKDVLRHTRTIVREFGAATYLRCCLGQALRAPASNVTYAAAARVDSFAWKSGSMRADPVKYSAGPFCDGCVPTRAMERETTVAAATMFISVLSTRLAGVLMRILK